MQARFVRIVENQDNPIIHILNSFRLLIIHSYTSYFRPLRHPATTMLQARIISLILSYFSFDCHENNLFVYAHYLNRYEIRTRKPIHARAMLLHATRALLITYT